jgi:ABC-2 type transport system ATP-binding protein
MLQLQGLTRRYGDLVALDDLSFTVAEGQMFGFVGPNGAGKTTAMRIILGVLEPDAGQVRWRGRLMTDEMRRRVGYMPEDHGQTFSTQCARIPGHSGASSATSASRSSTAAELRNQLICGAGPGLHQPLVLRSLNAVGEDASSVAR